MAMSWSLPAWGLMSEWDKTSVRKTKPWPFSLMINIKSKVVCKNGLGFYDVVECHTYRCQCSTGKSWQICHSTSLSHTFPPDFTAPMASHGTTLRLNGKNFCQKHRIFQEVHLVNQALLWWEDATDWFDHCLRKTHGNDMEEYEMKLVQQSSNQGSCGSWTPDLLRLWDLDRSGRKSTPAMVTALWGKTATAKQEYPDISSFQLEIT